MAATMPASQKKTALIIGGGIGGLTAIAGLRKLDQNVDILLVEPKDHMEIYWAAYRSPFEEWVANDSLIPLQKFCQKHNVTHIRDVVTKVDHDNNTASLQDKSDNISFDVCCVATGATTQWEGLGRGLPDQQQQYPNYDGSRDQRLAHMKETGQQLLNAGSIVIVGGSLIGTELAGDIAGYAQKAGKQVNVTLVHSGPYLCPVIGESAGKLMQQKLEALGVTVYLNDKAVVAKQDDDKKDKQSMSTVTLKTSGKVLKANKVIMTIGFSPLNSLVSDIPGALDDKGWIQTDEYFTIQGTKNLFAIGDCTTTLPNAGNQVMRNVASIGANLKAALDGVPEQRQSLTKAFEVYCTTAGPDAGIFYCSWFYTQYLLPWAKNSTMFFMSPKDMIGLEA